MRRREVVFWQVVGALALAALAGYLVTRWLNAASAI